MNKNRLTKIAIYIMLAMFTWISFSSGNSTDIFILYNSESFCIFNKNMGINIINILFSTGIIFCILYRSIVFSVESEKNISAIVKYHCKNKKSYIAKQFAFITKILLRDFLIYIGIIFAVLLISGVKLNITIIYLLIELFLLFLSFIVLHILGIILVKGESKMIIYYILGAIILIITLALILKIYI